MMTMLRRGDEGYRRLIEVLVGGRDEDDEDSPLDLIVMLPWSQHCLPPDRHV